MEASLGWGQALVALAGPYTGPYRGAGGESPAGEQGGGVPWGLMQLRWPGSGRRGHRGSETLGPEYDS